MSTLQREDFTGLSCMEKGPTAEERRGARRFWANREHLSDCRNLRRATVLGVRNRVCYTRRIRNKMYAAGRVPAAFFYL